MNRSRNQYNQRIGEDPYPDNGTQGGYGSGYGTVPDYGYETERSGAGGHGYANNYNANSGAYGGSANNPYDNAYSDGYGSGYGAANRVVTSFRQRDR